MRYAVCGMGVGMGMGMGMAVCSMRISLLLRGVSRMIDYGAGYLVWMHLAI